MRQEQVLASELTLSADSSWFLPLCPDLSLRHLELWCYPTASPSFIYICRLSHQFDVLLVLTVFDQSQASVMTIEYEWIGSIQWGTMGPNPNKQVGGVLCQQLVAQLMLHSEGDIRVIVLLGSDMWWEFVEKHLPEEVLQQVASLSCMGKICWVNELQEYL